MRRQSLLRALKVLAGRIVRIARCGAAPPLAMHQGYGRLASIVDMKIVQAIILNERRVVSDV